MHDLIGHFKATLYYGIVPVAVFSILNFLVAWLIAHFGSIAKREACIYGLSFGAIGIAVGLLTGLSRESVVGAVVPALLTFLSGFAVYEFGKSSYQELRPVLPIALVCLILGTICAAVFGASERNSYNQRVHRYEEWRLNYEKVELPIRREQLEQQLKLTPEKTSTSN